MTLEELREKLAAPDTDKPPVVKPKPKVRFQADDYREDRMRAAIEAHFDFHHCPFPDWQWMRTAEIAQELWDREFDRHSGVLNKLGRVMEALRRDGYGIQRRMLNGRTRWFIPAPRWRKHMYKYKTTQRGH